MTLNNQKVFCVFNNYSFGDILLTNALCQNIKSIYPDSKVVYVVQSAWEEVAKFQKDVDDVVVFDKRGKHKGIKGFLDFVWNFPYKNIFASLIVFGDERSILYARLLGSKYVVSQGKDSFYRRLLQNHPYPTSNNWNEHRQDTASLLLNGITNVPIQSFAIEYNPPEINNEVINKVFQLKNEKQLVALCATSSNVEKDFPIETTVDIVNRLNNENKKVLFVGAGLRSVEYVELLKNAGCTDFVNLINKTSVPELAVILKKCVGLISVDTGTMHLGCAVKSPTLGVFYQKNMIKMWGPDPALYNSLVVSEDTSADNICNKFKQIIETAIVR